MGIIVGLPSYTGERWDIRSLRKTNRFLPARKASLMKRWIILAALLASFLLQSGCGDGVAYTRRERQHRWAEFFEDDMEMLNSDIDLFMLNDRPSRLSRWK
jgi:hypothetical protein